MSHLSKVRAIFQIVKICRISQCFSRSVSAESNIGDSENSVDAKRLAVFKKHLKSLNITFKEGYTCIELPCTACANTAHNVAYINKRTGIFLCPSCDIKKSFSNVGKLYEKNYQNGDLKEFKGDIYHTKLTELKDVTEDICCRLGIRELKPSDIHLANGRYDNTADVIQFPLTNTRNILVGEKLLSITSKKEVTNQHENRSGLLVHGNKNKAILVTNLIDFLALLIQRIESYTVICLPYGLQFLPQECLPALEKYKEIIFWFKFDSAGWDTARNISSKLDEKRCLFIRPTDTTPAPYEAHQKRLNLGHILTKALPIVHKSIITFSALKNDILSELQNIEKVRGIKWKRFPMLNKLLKGHRKGELTILTGPTGCGKTTFVSEYSLDLALQGVSTLWGSFEIKNSRLAATLLRQFVGYSLEKKLNEFDYWTEQFEKYPLFFMTFHGQQPLKDVMEAIGHAQYVHDINHVVIDNLQFMMGISLSQRSDKFWEQDTIISAFRTFATQNNVHVTLVMHPRKERDADDLTTSSVFGTAKATQEADNVLIIQDKRLVSVRGKKYLQIVKNRYSGELGIMPLEFDKEGLSYSSLHKKKTSDKDKA